MNLTIELQADQVGETIVQFGYFLALVRQTTFGHFDLTCNMMLVVHCKWGYWVNLE